MDNFDKVLELLVKRISEELSKKLNSSDYSKNLTAYTNDAGFITNSVNDLVNYYKKNEVDGLIAALHSISMQVVESLPEMDQRENVIYLVPAKGPNAENAKDEYIWVDGKWELIGTTRIAITQVHKAEKNDYAKDDIEFINEYFGEGGAGAEASKAPGDVFVLTCKVDSKVMYTSSYMLNQAGTDWEPITGPVDYSKVIVTENITLAGNYTQVGNITKGQNETKTLEVKGKTAKDLFMEIFTKKQQPTITAQPAVSGFSLSGAKAVEAGTKVATATLSAASLSAGSYQFGPATGITATAWKIDRVTNVPTLNAKIADANTATDNNDGNGFIIGDGSEPNVVNSLKYTVTATHGDGTIANDNLGGASSPEVKIVGGTKTQTTSAYTPFRKYFYGHMMNASEINTGAIRALTHSTGAYKASSFQITVPKGATRVIVACIEGVTGLKTVINNSSLNADVTGVFTKQTVAVEGAEGYSAKNYNVWVWQPANPFELEAGTKLTITLG